MEFGEFKNTEAFNPTFKRVRELGLEQHAFELDSYGFTVVPPDKVADRAFFERIRETVLRVCKERTGIEFDLEQNGAFGEYKAQPQSDGQFLLFYLPWRTGSSGVDPQSDPLHPDRLPDAGPAAAFQPHVVREVEG